MNVIFPIKRHFAAAVCMLAFNAVAADAELWIGSDPLADDSDILLKELLDSSETPLEGLVATSSSRKGKKGYASYYASRFIGRRTTSGHRYHPDKLTAAHHDLPLGTVVRVVNPATSQAVEVTVNDRCAPKPFPFIDLSRAAAQKIGLWGKGKIKVVIVPLEEPT